MTMVEFVSYLALVLSVVSMVLHVVAPKTKTKIDDKILEVVDELMPMLPKDDKK